MPTKHPSSIILPNKKSVQVQFKRQINLHPNLSTMAKETLIVPKQTKESLLSIGQFCGDGFQVCFKKDNIDIKKNNKLIPQGSRNYVDG